MDDTVIVDAVIDTPVMVENLLSLLFRELTLIVETVSVEPSMVEKTVEFV